MAKRQTSIEISGGQTQGIIGASQVRVEKLTIINYTNPAPVPDLEPAALDIDLPNPYRGLFHFGPDDAKYFFGREVFVTKLVKAINTPRNFIAVLGASGSGKSSVVLAGLVPQLTQKSLWKFTHFRPSNGDDPFHALARALTPLYNPDLNRTEQMKQARELANYFRSDTVPLQDVIGTIQETYPHYRILLIADQFEELYTLTADRTLRHQFLDILLKAIQANRSNRLSPITLVLTMRADFLEQASLYPPFTKALQGAIQLLSPMERQDLIRAILEPAKYHKVIFEDGLIDTILDDVGQEAGKLPLLQFALNKLWQQQNQRRLTHTAYWQIGRIDGALTQHADDVYNKLSPEQKLQARRIFVRLVHPGEGTADTRSLATRAELENDWSLVQELAAQENRLVVTKTNILTADDETIEEIGEATVEVIHEALIQNWKFLREWLEDDREFRIWLERLRLWMKPWEAKKNESDLLRGTTLALAKDWLSKRTADLSRDEQEFIQESINLEQREMNEREARQQKQLKDMQELALARKQAIEQNLRSLEQARGQIEDGLQEANRLLTQLKNWQQKTDRVSAQIQSRRQRLTQIQTNLQQLYKVMAQIEVKSKSR